MPGVSDIVKAERRTQVLNMIANGFNMKEIMTKLEISQKTLDKDTAALKNQAKEFLNDTIKNRTSESFSLTMANIDDILHKVAILYEQTMDERTKIQLLRLVIDTARLRNETVIDGFNHIALKESNDLLEKTLNLNASAATGPDTKQLPNFMPTIEVKMEPDAARVNVEGVLPPVENRDDSQEPKIELENVSKSEELQKKLNLGQHVRTNVFNRMETEEIMK